MIDHITDCEFAEVLERAAEEAARLREDDRPNAAAWLEMRIEAFRDGMNRRLPPEWRPHLNEVRKTQHPEWAEYQRLKQLFEEKEA